MNQVWKFATRLTIFLILIYVADYAIGSQLEKFYFLQKQGTEYHTTYAMDSVKAELLIFGSSRACHHYDPGVLSPALNESFYNVGRDWQSIFYDYSLLSAISKRYFPKTIILDITIDELQKDQGSYDRMSSLLPYVNRYETIRELVQARGPFEKVKLLSRIYPYNSLIIPILAGNISRKTQQNVDVLGFLPLEENKQCLLLEYLPQPDELLLDELKLTCLEKFIQLAKSNNCALTLITSPYLTDKPPQAKSLSLIDSLCKKMGIHYMNFSYCNGLSDNKSLFKDQGHLNATGARLFSQIVADSLVKFHTESVQKLK
jgi:hypothetical protein